MTVGGGLAEFSIVPDGEHKYSVKIGDRRLFDLVEQGGAMLAEFKPAKRDAIVADPVDLLRQLIRKIDPNFFDLMQILTSGTRG